MASDKKRQMIAFALNEWEDKSYIDDWAKRHGFRNATEIARRKFYEYLIKTHCLSERVKNALNGKEYRKDKRGTG